jgi:hypothetical protein
MSVKNKRSGPVPNGMPAPALREVGQAKYDALQHAHRLLKELRKAKVFLRKLVAVDGLHLTRTQREEIAEILGGQEH